MINSTNQLLSQVIINPVIGPNIQALSGVEFIERLIRSLISLGFVIGAVIFFFMFITGAIAYMTSGGDKGATEAAKKRITNAFIGITILLSTFAIISLVEYFFGTNLMEFRFGTLNISSGPSTPGPGPSPSDPVNANCPCSVSLGGGCATTGTIAIGPGSQCFQCTDSGWTSVSGPCSVITCSSCP